MIPKLDNHGRAFPLLESSLRPRRQKFTPSINQQSHLRALALPRRTIHRSSTSVYSRAESSPLKRHANHGNQRHSDCRTSRRRCSRTISGCLWLAEVQSTSTVSLSRLMGREMEEEARSRIDLVMLFVKRASSPDEHELCVLLSSFPRSQS